MKLGLAKNSEAGNIKILSLKKRIDFLALREGKKISGRGFSLIGKERSEEQSINNNQSGSAVRVGFTVTKKNGNAVLRNRIKRRLRAAIHSGAGCHLLPKHDYNIIGFNSSLHIPFEELTAQIKKCAIKYRRLNSK